MNRRALLIGAGAAIAVLVLWFVLLWSPQGSRLNDAKARTAAAAAAEGTSRLELQRLQGLQAQEPLKRARLQTLEAAVPPEAFLGQFILDVNDTAIRSGIDFVSISQTPPAPGAAGLLEVKLSFSINGGYFQVLDFINRLEALPRLVSLDSVSFSPLAASPGGPVSRISSSIVGRMFVAPAAPPPTTPPPPAPAPPA